MRSFRDLKAWQHAKTLAVACSKLADQFPAQDRFELGGQLRRAGYSAALNIAEGAARRGPRDFRHFLDIARASLQEVDAILELARELGYVTAEQHHVISKLRAEAARTTHGLLLAIARRAAASGS